MRLDRTYFRKQTFEQAADHRSDYLSMNEAERSEAFFILMQASFGFVGEPWPRMEKNVFKKRRRHSIEED
jgi:hypothetical protein